MKFWMMLTSHRQILEILQPILTQRIFNNFCHILDIFNDFADQTYFAYWEDFEFVDPGIVFVSSKRRSTFHVTY